MKKWLVWVLVIAIAIFMAGCNADKPDNEPVPDESPVYSQEIEQEQPEEMPPEEEVLPDPVDIYADFEVTRNPDNSFYIETNLPDGTELSLTLSGRGYLAQDKTFVTDGCATSNCFSNRGNPLQGKYTLTVMMPIVSVQSDYVKHFVGSNGEYLRGPYVKGALGSVIVEKEFSFTIPNA